MISAAQLDLMDSLRAGPQTAAWLIGDTGRNKKTVYLSLERLRRQGLVSRAKAGRLASFALTDEGRAAVERGGL